jgi:hypothetical protein
MDKDTEDIPLVAKPFVKLYRATPKVYFPGTTSVEVGFVTLWMVLFAISRKVMVELMILSGWPDDLLLVSFGSGCLVGGLLHSPLLLPVLYVLLRAEPYKPSAAIEDYPKWWQDAADAMLQLSTGYMVYDTLYPLAQYLIYGKLNPDYTMYMIHHMLVAFYFVSVQVVGGGHASVIMGTFLGEVTNPFYNLSHFSALAIKQDCCHGSFSRRLNVFFDVLAALQFIPVRALIGPIVLGFYTVYQLVFVGTKRKHHPIPLIMAILWSLIMWAVMLGSYSYLMELSIKLATHYKELFQEKSEFAEL